MCLSETIKKIKYARLKPEERFLLNILIKIQKKKHKEYPNTIYYIFNNKIYFEYEQCDNELYCNYYEVMHLLLYKYKMDRYSFNQLIRKHFIGINANTGILMSEPYFQEKIWSSIIDDFNHGRN